MGPVTERVLNLRYSGDFRKPHQMRIAQDVADAIRAENIAHGSLIDVPGVHLFGIPVIVDPLLPPSEIWVEHL